MGTEGKASVVGVILSRVEEEIQSLNFLANFHGFDKPIPIDVITLLFNISRLERKKSLTKIRRR